MKLDPKVYELAAEMVDSGKSNGHHLWLKHWSHLPSCFAIDCAMKKLGIQNTNNYHHYFNDLYFDPETNPYSGSVCGAYFGYAHSGKIREESIIQKNHRSFALLMAAQILREKYQRKAKPGVEYKWTRNPKNMKGGIPRNLRPESIVTYKMNEPDDTFVDEQPASNLDWKTSLSKSAWITAYKVIEY